MMERKLVLAVIVALASCQASEPYKVTDFSKGVTDRKVAAVFKAQYEGQLSGLRALKLKCDQRWAPDGAMVEHCVSSQFPKMKRFVDDKATAESLVKDGSVSKDYAKPYQRCEVAYWGDYEMATACVENEEAVKRLSAF